MVAELHRPLRSQSSPNVSTRNPISMTKLIHPMTFIDKLVKKNDLGQPFTLMDHQREILRLAFALKTAGCRGTRFFIPASRSREDDDVDQGDRAVFPAHDGASEAKDRCVRGAELCYPGSDPQWATDGPRQSGPRTIQVKPVWGKFDARQPTFPGYGVRRMR